MTGIVQQRAAGDWEEHRGRGNKRRHEPPPPSTSIVLKGLGPTITEDEVHNKLV